MIKEQRINVRVKKELADDLNEIAAVLDIPASQIVRDGVRDKVAEMKRTHPRLCETAQTVLNG